MFRLIHHLPREVGKKLVDRLNEDAAVIIMRSRQGAIRIYNLRLYLGKKERMRKIIQETKPWLRRQKSLLGPIGSKPLGIQGHLSRSEIYEGR